MAPAYGPIRDRTSSTISLDNNNNNKNDPAAGTGNESDGSENSDSSLQSFSYYYTYSNKVVGGSSNGIIGYATTRNECRAGGGGGDESLVDATTIANTTIPVSEYHHMIKSKCDSPFLLRKLPRVGVGDVGDGSSRSNVTSASSSAIAAAVLKSRQPQGHYLPPIAAYDSGVSSLSSAQMFFADISEFWAPTTAPPTSARVSCDGNDHRRMRTASSSCTSIPLRSASSSHASSHVLNFFTQKLGLIK